MSFFELIQQCCDADHYLQMGKICAETGDCYNQLRPMGNAYWFSVPYRLGLGPGYFVVAHLALTLVSILLSVISLQYFFKGIKNRRFVIISLCLVSTVVHVIFLYPVFRVSLSDLPASLFFLTGVWGLILFHFSQDRYKACWMIMAGIMFGAAVWMRIYFFGPVLLLIFVMGFGSFFKEKTDFRENFLLIAMIPVFIQFAAVYRHTGYIAYAEKDISNEVKRIHQTIHASGWDTVLPVQPTGTPSGWAWPSACENVVCHLAGKAYFYLGSYAPDTYHIYDKPGVDEYCLFAEGHQYPEEKCESFTIRNIKQEIVPQMKPDLYSAGTKPWQDISRLATVAHDVDVVLAHRISKEDKLATAEAFQTLTLEKGHQYAFAVWAWTEDKHVNLIEVFIRRRDGKEDITSTGLILFEKPGFVDAIADIDETGLYDVGVRWRGYREGHGPEAIGYRPGLKLNQQPFYLWGARLQRGINDAWSDAGSAQVYKPPRWWSPVLFVTHAIVFFLAFLMLHRVFHKDILLSVSLGSAFLAISVMGFVVVPEQRFFIATMILSWLLAFVYFMTWMFSDRESQTVPD